MRPRLNDLTKFNREVLRLLRLHDELAAEELNAHGSTNGWWDVARHDFYQRRSPESTVDRLLQRWATT